MRTRIPRLWAIFLAFAMIGLSGIVLYNVIAASAAEEIPLDRRSRAIAKRAKAEYLGQVPLSFTSLRLVVTSVETCEEDGSLILFDDHTWFGRRKAFVRYRVGEGVTGGGTVRTPRSLDESVRRFRARCGQ